MSATETMIRLVARCPRCKAGNAKDFSSAQEAADFPWRGQPTCSGCGRMVPGSYWKQVSGTYSEGKACGARCTSSLGPSCDCKCGGQNHASDHRH